MYASSIYCIYVHVYIYTLVLWDSLPVGEEVLYNMMIGVRLWRVAWQPLCGLNKQNILLYISILYKIYIERKREGGRERDREREREREREG